MAFALPITLIFGAIFAPADAKASLFASLLLGNDALAQQTNIPNKSDSTLLGDNSQTMGLLQANVSSASVLQDKGPKENKKDGKDNTGDSPVDPKATVNIVSDTSLLPATGPMGVSDGTDNTNSSDSQTSVYVVHTGDNIATVAKMFGVSVNTILWANDMKKGDKLNEGDVLFILPVSGVEHTVAKGQTIQSIAKLYKADVNDIIQANDITLNTPLAVGDTLMIPDGMKDEGGDKPLKNPDASTAKDKKYYDSHPTYKNLSGYYINPVPGCVKTQGLHDGDAVDLGCPTGTPIHAAASGRVIFARMGWNGAYGNLVIISHSNGTQTLYAHQSKIATSVGAEVSQGEVIGYVGSTGHSTGPHLHFGVKGARNPGVDGSWAR